MSPYLTFCAGESQYINLMKSLIMEKDNNSKIVMEKNRTAFTRYLYSEMISIVGDLEFEALTVKRIEKICMLKPGRVLMKNLKKTVTENGKIRIVQDNKKFAYIPIADKVKCLKRDKVENVGIEYGGDPTAKLYATPGFISLAHELIHCLHFRTEIDNLAIRLFSTDDCLPDMHNEEEQLTICAFSHKTSYPKVKADLLCENAFNLALGLPMRINHVGVENENFLEIDDKKFVSTKIENLEERIDFHWDWVKNELKGTQNEVDGIEFERLSKIFGSLEGDFWKQIYGSKDHEMISERKDISGEKCAFDFASENLSSLPTVEFYKELHKRNCEIFGKVENELTAGQFCGLKYSRYCSEKLFNLDEYEKINEFYFWDDLIYQEEKTRRKPQLHRQWLEKNKITEQEFKAGLRDSKKLQNTLRTEHNGEIYQIVKEKVSVLNREITKRCQQLGFSKPFVEISLNSHTEIYFHYNYMSGQFDGIVEKLFDVFAEKNRKSYGKIRHIADLYQMLQWLHPFQVNQEKTDAILLSKLLTENGLNPCILEDFSFAKFRALDEWTDYLEKGISAWLKLGNSQKVTDEDANLSHSDPHSSMPLS